MARDESEQCEYCERYKDNLILDGNLYFCSEKHQELFWLEQIKQQRAPDFLELDGIDSDRDTDPTFYDPDKDGWL